MKKIKFILISLLVIVATAITLVGCNAVESPFQSVYNSTIVRLMLYGTDKNYSGLYSVKINAWRVR